jgi:hypothetical protein
MLTKRNLPGLIVAKNLQETMPVGTFCRNASNRFNFFLMPGALKSFKTGNGYSALFPRSIHHAKNKISWAGPFDAI